MLSDQAISVKLAAKMGLVHPLIHDIEGLTPLAPPELTVDQMQVKRAVVRYAAPIILVLGDAQAALTMALAEELPNSSFIVADPWETDEEYNAAIATIYPQRTRILPLASDMQQMLAWRVPPLGLVAISQPDRIADLGKVVDEAWSMLGRGGVLASVRGNGAVAAMRQLRVPVSTLRGKATITEPRRDGPAVTDVDGKSVNFTRIRQNRTDAAVAKNGRGKGKSTRGTGAAGKGAGTAGKLRSRARELRVVQPRDARELPIQIFTQEMQEQNSNRLTKFKAENQNRGVPRKGFDLS